MSPTPDAAARTIDEEPDQTLRLAVACLSDIGCKRRGNQDVASAFLSSDHRQALLLVADGMGGQLNGEQASRTASEMLSQRFLRGELKSGEALAELILAADERIAREFEGAGTTVVVALVDARSFRLAHVGDSRAYLFRDGALRQLTVDHSWVQAQVDAGRLTKEEAFAHPRRNVLLRAVGTGRQEAPELRAFRLLPGDVLLLCSDGLHGPLDDCVIAATLRSATGIDEAAARLIAAARAAGGPDNISVSLAAVVEDD